MAVPRKYSRTDLDKKSLAIRIDRLAHEFNVTRRRRLVRRTSYPRPSVVPLHRGLLSKLASLFGFGD